MEHNLTVDTFCNHRKIQLNVHRFDSKAMNALEKSEEYATRTFPGFRFHAVAGFDIPASQRISLQNGKKPTLHAADKYSTSMAVSVIVK